MRSSLELQKQFGLRREECLKIKPSQALIKTSSGQQYIKLQGSWTKGGIERHVPIKTAAQLQAVMDAIKLVGKESMIPNELSYIQRRNQYDDLTHRAGFKNLHGLRHAYAQNRYQELTNLLSKGKGWNCPLDGGLKRREMTLEQKEIDKLAKIQISNEMGHSRIAIVKNYCG